MKRLFAALLMALALTATAVPAAQASHSRDCTEVWIHFRPAVCTDSHDGVDWLWVCPDGWWQYCVMVLPIPV
jgi:hypothetical protein